MDRLVETDPNTIYAAVFTRVAQALESLADAQHRLYQVQRDSLELQRRAVAIQEELVEDSRHLRERLEIQ